MSEMEIQRDTSKSSAAGPKVSFHELEFLFWCQCWSIVKGLWWFMLHTICIHICPVNKLWVNKLLSRSSRLCLSSNLSCPNSCVLIKCSDIGNKKLCRRLRNEPRPGTGPSPGAKSEKINTNHLNLNVYPGICPLLHSFISLFIVFKFSASYAESQIRQSPGRDFSLRFMGFKVNMLWCLLCIRYCRTSGGQDEWWTLRHSFWFSSAVWRSYHILQENLCIHDDISLSALRDCSFITRKNQKERWEERDERKETITRKEVDHEVRSKNMKEKEQKDGRNQ